MDFYASPSSRRVPAPRPHHYMLLACAVAGFAPSGVIARLAGEASPLVISFYRLLFASLMIAPFAVYQARRERENIRIRDVAFLAGVGFLLAAHFATWVTSLF